MRKTTLILAAVLTAALCAPAFATINPAPQKTQLEQLAKKGGSKKAPKAPKKAKA